MIRLEKTAKPQILVDNAETWTKEYCDNLTAGKKTQNRYNRKDIKDALIAETHGKCAYCESKVLATDYGDVEHILPKHQGARPDLCFEWSNLTLACARCNRTGKGDYYDEELPLINPYVDYPENHFVPATAFVFAKPSDERAKNTECVLDLNREGLLEARKKCIDNVRNLLDLWARTDLKPSLKVICENQLHETYTKDKEHSFIVRGYLAQVDFPVNT